MERLEPAVTGNHGRYSEKQQRHYTLGDAKQQFTNAMLDAGITPPETIIGDGLLHRFKTNGKLNGRYVLHTDGRPAGYFQDFKQGIKVRWKMGGDFKPFTPAERRAFAIERQRQEIARQAEEAKRHDEAAIKARVIWPKSTPITAPSQHSYLLKKHVNPHNARLYGDALAIPIYNECRQLVNLQFINADGAKRFLTGGKKKGCFSVIGKLEATDPILIPEGWATGASLHEHTGHFVIVAMDAGNLEPVALAVRRLYPDREIVLCGDNDLSGVGQKAAKAAALAVGGKYILPATVGHDWNDALTVEIAQ